MSDSFATRMKEARLGAGFGTLEALADKAGCSKQQLSEIELGRTQEVKMLLLYALADTCRVSPRWLATGKGTKRNTGPMTDHERDLIYILRHLPEPLQAHLVSVAESLAAAAERPSPVAPFGKSHITRK